tara:strand:+ start:456 stop:1223 length:768 start_codon:yes stop_codon:yes gene_type:complete
MRFYKSKETIEEIKRIINNKEHGLYLRFGDGDVNLANGSKDLLQASNEALKKEMIEAFKINDVNVLKALPLHCEEYGLEVGMFPGNHECDKVWADNLLNKVKPFWGKSFDKIYSPVALHFLATVEPDYILNFFKFLKLNKPIAIIGNKNIQPEIVDKLFGLDCKHIKTPIENSFNSIDSSELEFDKIYKPNQYNLIITAMGCSGRVLQKRLYKKYDNIFIFDFGSLMDALCGWNTRAWIELSKFNKDEFLKKLYA